MNKKQFIAGLKEALELRVDKKTLKEQVDYYHNYIITEIGKGRKESDVIEELGDPWAIAKNIEVNMGEGIEFTSQSDEGSISKERERKEKQGKSYVWSSNSNRGCWIFLILFILIIFVLMTIFVGVLRILSPILYPLLLVILLVRLFKSR